MPFDDNQVRVSADELRLPHELGVRRLAADLGVLVERLGAASETEDVVSQSLADDLHKLRDRAERLFAVRN